MQGQDRWGSDRVAPPVGEAARLQPLAERLAAAARSRDFPREARSPCVCVFKSLQLVYLFVATDQAKKAACVRPRDARV